MRTVLYELGFWSLVTVGGIGTGYAVSMVLAAWGK